MGKVIEPDHYGRDRKFENAESQDRKECQGLGDLLLIAQILEVILTHAG